MGVCQTDYVQSWEGRVSQVPHSAAEAQPSKLPKGQASPSPPAFGPARRGNRDKGLLSQQTRSHRITVIESEHITSIT